MPLLVKMSCPKYRTDNLVLGLQSLGENVKFPYLSVIMWKISVLKKGLLCVKLKRELVN